MSDKKILIVRYGGVTAILGPLEITGKAEGDRYVVEVRQSMQIFNKVLGISCDEAIENVRRVSRAAKATA